MHCYTHSSSNEKIDNFLLDSILAKLFVALTLKHTQHTHTKKKKRKKERNACIFRVSQLRQVRQTRKMYIFVNFSLLMASIGGKWINWLTKSVMTVQIFTPFSLAVCNVH